MRVSRLSILIPAEGGAEPLERTLASVLQNRPEACEVIVVTHGEYDDPYELAGEVRFLAAPLTAGSIQRIQHGLRHCRGPVVHVLRAGVEATDHWTDVPLAHFEEANVAAVAPLIVDASDQRRVVSAGLDYRTGGRLIVRAAGESVDCTPSAAQHIVGPALSAAFYRLEALQRCGDDFDTRLGIQFAGADWALAMRRRGYVSLFEPSSRLVGEADPRDVTATARAAWQAERLFWRHAATIGWTRSLAAHGGVVLAECARHWKSPQVAVSRLAGMLVGCGWAISHRKPAGRKVAAQKPAVTDATVPNAAVTSATGTIEATSRVIHRTDAGEATTPAPRRDSFERAH